MRVLHLLKTSEGATWALRQMRELVKLGIEVHVALPSGGRHFYEYAQNGIVTHDLQNDFSLNSISSRSQALQSLVNRLQPDVLHSHFVGTTLTMRVALKKHHLPRIFQVPGPLHLEHYVYRTAEIKTADQNDVWIGSCKKTLEYYRDSGISENRLFLSYYGTDIEDYRRKNINTLRADLGISNQSKVVGMVAYMYAPKRHLGQTRGLKGHEDLIDAIKIGLGQGHDLHLIVVGSAWLGAKEYERQLKEYAQRQIGNRAHFLGYRSDVSALYPQLDVAVHPSYSENVGGAVESLLLEVPTVATRVGGFPDLVQNASTGWLANPKDPQDLWRAILKVLRDPENASVMANAGCEKARFLFDVKRTSKEIAAIYDILREKQRVKRFYEY